MDNFLRYFFQDINNILDGFAELFKSLWYCLNMLFNFPKRFDLIKQYDESFTTTDWILVLVVNAILLVFAIALIIGVIVLLKKIFRFRVPAKKYDELKKQVQHLQRDLVRANYEKDRLLAMRSPSGEITSTEKTSERPPQISI